MLLLQREQVFVPVKLVRRDRRVCLSVPAVNAVAAIDEELFDAGTGDAEAATEAVIDLEKDDRRIRRREQPPRTAEDLDLRPFDVDFEEIGALDDAVERRDVDADLHTLLRGRRQR